MTLMFFLSQLPVEGFSYLGKIFLAASLSQMSGVFCLRVFAQETIADFFLTHLPVIY